MRGAWSVRLAAAGLTVSGALAVAAGVRAARVDPIVPTLPAAASPTPADPFPAGAAPATGAAREAAVLYNPFHPERRPGAPFRLPGREDEPSFDPEDGWAPDEMPAPVSLVGTVVTPDGADFVVCRAGGEPARLVRLGEVCGSLTLVAVRRGAADFQGPDGDRIVVEVPKEGSM